MAKATLPVNFKDDILDPSMDGKRRYRIIKNSDDTVSLEDVTDYTQVGSNFGAAQINATNTSVNNSADKANIIDDIDDIAANVTPGKMAGALAVKQLNANFNLQEGELTVYADRETVYGYYIQKMNKQVCLWINVGTTSSIAEGHKIADIPDGYRPGKSFIISVPANDNKTYPFRVNTDGSITAAMTVPSGTNIRIHEFYFTK